MGIIIGVIIGLCLMANCMWAQTPADEINAIKLQAEVYVYAEFVSSKSSEALEYAKLMLEDAVMGWISENVKLESSASNELANKAISKATIIEARRGERYRTFMYVSRADLETLAGSSLKKNDVSLSTPTTHVAPIEEPVAMQPATEPTYESVPKTTPSATEEEFVSLDEFEEEGEDVKSEVNTFQRTPLEDDILAISHAQNIQPFIKKLQSENRILRFGKYADMPSDINCYLFVYDRNMNIPAYLRKEGAIYINLKTGEMDDVANYKGCGAIWFRIRN